MNRRELLGLISGLALTPMAALPRPKPYTAAPVLRRIPQLEFVRHTELFDYGMMQGLAVRTAHKGRMYRHAVLIHEKTWREMRPSQKQYLWKFVENHVRGMIQ